MKTNFLQDIRESCQEIPTQASVSPKGLSRFQKTLQNLKESLRENGGKILDDYGFPATVGAVSLIATTDLLRNIAQSQGQIPTHELTTYPALGLAAITTLLLSIPWKNHQNPDKTPPKKPTEQVLLTKTEASGPGR
jgi:hypothetical protein